MFGIIEKFCGGLVGLEMVLVIIGEEFYMIEDVYELYLL